MNKIECKAPGITETQLQKVLWEMVIADLEPLYKLQIRILFDWYTQRIVYKSNSLLRVGTSNGAYADYNTWTKDTGGAPLTKPQFTKALISVARLTLDLDSQMTFPSEVLIRPKRKASGLHITNLALNEETK